MGDPFDDISSVDAALDELVVDDVHNPKWPNIVKETSDNHQYSTQLSHDEKIFLPDEEFFRPLQSYSTFPDCKLENTVAEQSQTFCRDLDSSSVSTSVIDSELSGISTLAHFIKTPVPNEGPDLEPRKKKVQKPPTTAGITLDNLKAVFGLERPEAEKRLGLKRTTFSNLSRFYGISKWPFRTIRDASNRKKANERLLRDTTLSNEKRKKLLRQQAHLQGVINLMYSDPSQSKDSNTLAVLMNIVSSRENKQHLHMIYDFKNADK